MAWDGTTYQGGKFNQRGLAMYKEVERLTPFDIFVSQGGFNTGGVAASAGTHDLEAVDISASLLTPDQRWTVCTNGRRVGYAMWIRTPAQGFSWHLHGVPIGGELSTAARAQVVQYSQQKNGLAGGGPDDGPPGYYDMTWEKYQNSSAYRPPIDIGTEEDDLTPEEHGWLKDLSSMMNAFKGGPEGPSYQPFFQTAALRGGLEKKLPRAGGLSGDTSLQSVVQYFDSYMKTITDRLTAIEKRLG